MSRVFDEFLERFVDDHQNQDGQGGYAQEHDSAHDTAREHKRKDKEPSDYADITTTCS